MGAEAWGREAAAKIRRTPMEMHRGQHSVTLEGGEPGQGATIAAAIAWLLGSTDLQWLHEHPNVVTDPMGNVLRWDAGSVSFFQRDLGRRPKAVKSKDPCPDCTVWL